jgi:hypothetical protein
MVDDTGGATLFAASVFAYGTAYWVRHSVKFLKDEDVDPGR